MPIPADIVQKLNAMLGVPARPHFTDAQTEQDNINCLEWSVTYTGHDTRPESDPNWSDASQKQKGKARSALLPHGPRLDIHAFLPKRPETALGRLN